MACIRPTLASILLLLLLTAACQTRDRAAPESDCGAPGTNTVMQPGGCYCVADHVLNDMGSGCVPTTAPMAPADGGVPSDAGEHAPTDAGHIMGTLREIPSSSGTCAAGCAAVGFPCATSCEETPAGFASYGYYDWDYGWYRGVHRSDFASCEETPAPTYSEGGETYELGRMVCCCEIPEVTVRSADTSDTRTCDEVCTDEGFEGCADFAEWSNEDANGGTLATYYRPETGSVTDVVMGCGANPPPMRNIAGANRQLRGYRCACL